MAQHDDERRLLRWIADEGGPSGTVNAAARTGEVGLDVDRLGSVTAALSDRGLVEVLDDGDLRLTALGRAMVESADT